MRRYPRDGQARRYKQREPRPTKLDPSKGHLLKRVTAAQPHLIPATVLLRELQEASCESGINQFKYSWRRISVWQPSRWCPSRSL